MRLEFLSAFTVSVMVLAALALVPTADVQAQGEPFVELLRQDLQTDKVMLMTAAMDLTSDQGEIFWPIYREFQTELSKIGDSRIQLIKDYAENYESMTEDKAQDLAKTSFGIQEKQLKLMKKTHKKIAKEIGPIVAARFVQAEGQMQLLINLQIASEMPLIK